MTMGKRTQAAALEVRLLREGIIESRHIVQAVVSDDRGRVLSVAGNAETAAFVRSALKPFQALAITSTGTLERYGLSDKDLAIITSSHKGSMEQVRQVFNILWRADIDINALHCPIPQGKSSALEYNCSGKHAGMLAVCQQRHWPLTNYLDRKHPVQQLIITKVAELLRMPAAEFLTAHDDCGAPTYLMQLSQMASLYAVLASSNSVDMERIVRAMNHHPTMVAGVGEFDTELMRLTPGELVSKSGAEGVQCIGRLGEGMGLAIKVMDGSTRAKYAVAIHILQQMGWISPSIAQSLSEKFMNLGKYKRLEVIGELSLL
ncbi:asparaginase [Dolichospermum sp. UHCC 0684]|jgi:L-asparaginase|uniref:asparaginase n=1 Tax=Nostocales TaxID=1161 RepID=UPI00029B735E|nr:MULTISPECIES: asparaginase [Nostocales]MBO1047931.1 asparaginase [Dolichospermum sp. DEX182a]MBO1053655.1 asparaginase [Dolichospermum sp. DET73]MBO1055035.1 asparaginase [Dolichospermum sp. JUN01]MBS9383459.1 asparaginase [Dolichospermum sp. BR01]MBS9389635.1 asparaginase [Dolichospermum sp. WA123]MBS9393058.1 asparaginase [Dolichospermum sp. OL01]MCO5796694.1 asparaginase [Dolichospermum sp. OL03]MCS6280042.1 asparaginase [Dolichospermum sp.]QSV53555.1 MAG: asparaginase [Dolichospermu